MIEVLTHIETRPLASADFKQANPPAPRTLIEEWARNAVPHQVPAPTQQVPVSTPTSPSVKFSASSIVSEGPWAPPATPATPQPSNAPVSAPVSAPTSVAAQVQEQALPASPITADPIVAAPVPPLTQVSDSTVDDSFTTAPAQEYVEDVAEALVVKVVDDMPVLDASSAVATAETEIQPSLPSTGTIPGIPSGPDVSQQRLQLPSQFYKVICPNSGADGPKAV